VRRQAGFTVDHLAIHHRHARLRRHWFERHDLGQAVEQPQPKRQPDDADDQYPGGDGGDTAEPQSDEDEVQDANQAARTLIGGVDNGLGRIFGHSQSFLSYM